MSATTTEMYSNCHPIQIPGPDLFMGRLSKLVYMTSCLPGRDYSLSGFNFEKMVSKALGEGSHYSANRSAVDIVRTVNGVTVGFQIKTSKTVRKSFVWSRIALKDKLERIPASHVSVNMCQEIGEELLESFLGIVAGGEVEVDTLYYLQAMREGNSMKVLIASICVDAVSRIMDQDIQWSWSEPLSGRYPVLEGRLGENLLFSWAGLSGNHFKIMDMPKFLDMITSSTPAMFTLPLRQTPMTFEELEPTLLG